MLPSFPHHLPDFADPVDRLYFLPFHVLLSTEYYPVRWVRARNNGIDADNNKRTPPPTLATKPS
jgi:hypothetical protein